MSLSLFLPTIFFLVRFFFFSVPLTLSACKEGVCFCKVPVLSDLHHLYGLAFCHSGSSLAVVCYVLTGVCYKAEDHAWLCLSNFPLSGDHKPMLLKCSLWREWNSDNKSLGIKEPGWGWIEENLEELLLKQQSVAQSSFKCRCCKESWVSQYKWAAEWISSVLFTHL